MSAATEAPLLRPGSVLGERFEIEAPLGEGGMGVVFRARDRMSDRPAAVKVLRRNLIQSKEFVARFKREARAAARFRHDAAVRVLATGETEDRLPYIAMELVEGRSLDEIVKTEAPLAPGRACSLVQQLLRALGSAHQLGIVHRDMKPANIRVVPDADGIERPKILDFGVAKFVRGDMNDMTGGFKTKTGVILGTPKYMSPEQIRGDAIDGRADVYAVGAMLHEMLTGKPPFEAADVFGFVAMHLKQDVPPITQRFPDLDVPPDLDEVVLRMLAKDPKDRPEDAALLADELERFAVADPRAAEKRSQAMRGAVACVAAGVVGAAAAWFVAPGSGPAAAAAALGLGGGAAFASVRFGRPSVFQFVRRLGVVLAVVGVLAALSLAIPGSPGAFVTGSCVLSALVVYALYLAVWHERVVALRFVAAGVAAPLLCLVLFPVRIDAGEGRSRYTAVYLPPADVPEKVVSAAKTEAVLALAALAIPFAAASLLLPRPGAARRS